MSVVLWIIQGLLAALFVFAGGIKSVLPADQLVGPFPLPLWFIRFIGVAEVLGAIGLILPGMLRIKPGLTPLAAVGLILIMIGATVMTALADQFSVALISAVTGLLAGFVAYGRWGLLGTPSRR